MNEQQVSNNQQLNAADSPETKLLHPNAGKLIREYVNSFAESLIAFSKGMAYKEGDELVLTNHVKEALEIVRRNSKRSKWKELAIFISSAILGFSIQGFLGEISKFSETPSSGNSSILVTYVILTIVASVIATIAILK